MRLPGAKSGHRCWGMRKGRSKSSVTLGVAMIVKGKRLSRANGGPAWICLARILLFGLVLVGWPAESRKRIDRSRWIYGVTLTSSWTPLSFRLCIVQNPTNA